MTPTRNQGTGPAGPRSALALVLVAVLAGCSGDQPEAVPAADETAAARTEGDAGGDASFPEALLGLRLRAALLEHLGLDGLGVAVDVAGDTVTLSGEVEDPANKMLARQVALSIEGVEKVENRLEVAGAGEGRPIGRAVSKAEGELADALLEARIKARLVEELGRVGFAIKVEAVDGTVSLRGTVPDRERRDLALRVIGRLEGVEEVHDLLLVAS